MQERRNDDRLPVLWEAELVDENDQRFPCAIRDISYAGALVTCDAEFNRDADLLLEIKDLGEFAGRIKWAGSGALGLILLAGDDLALKQFAEKAGSALSTHPEPSSDLAPAD